ncbi:MAG: fused MFS/spermidine synthase [Candidatus Dadabacteria bacterium]|nr:fused MFS/spermidine synthase [Candidatus Dadabacteria bacterium]
MKKLIFLTAFIEGFCVMVIEIGSSRIITPVYGTSLTSWSIILAITLFGLACGYFLGARISGSRSYLVIALVTSGVVISLVPYLAQEILYLSMSFPFTVGLTLSLFVLMFPPFMLLGTISPLLIHRLDALVMKAGYSAGSIFGTSTVGGIVGALFCGFYLFPFIGARLTFLLIGVMMMLISAIVASSIKSRLAIVVLIVLTILISSYSTERNKNGPQNPIILSTSEGILGQIKVVEYPLATYGNRQGKLRLMLVNNTVQAAINPKDRTILLLQYQTLLTPIVKSNIKGARVLMIGLGGGGIINALQETEYEKIDVVELDKRIIHLARKYFLKETRDVNFITLDGRYYIETCRQKYDIVILDAFQAESIPSHLLTVECFRSIKVLLSDKGLLIVNFHGYIKGRQGLAARSVIRSMTHIGMQTMIIATDTTDGVTRSLLFVASMSDLNHLENILVPRSTDAYEEQKTELRSYVIDHRGINWDVASLLYDDHLMLEALLNEVNMEWRSFIQAKELIRMRKTR